MAPGARSGTLWLTGCASVWRSPPLPSWGVATAARYFRRIFAVSVFPAPDSPEMMTDWLMLFCIKPMCADAATAYTCGGNSAWGCSEALYCPRTSSVYSGSCR